MFGWTVAFSIEKKYNGYKHIHLLEKFKDCFRFWENNINYFPKHESFIYINFKLKKKIIELYQYDIMNQAYTLNLKKK